MPSGDDVTRLFYSFNLGSDHKWLHQIKSLYKRLFYGITIYENVEFCRVNQQLSYLEAEQHSIVQSITLMNH